MISSSEISFQALAKHGGNFQDIIKEADAQQRGKFHTFTYAKGTECE